MDGQCNAIRHISGRYSGYKSCHITTHVEHLYGGKDVASSFGMISAGAIWHDKSHQNSAALQIALMKLKILVGKCFGNTNKHAVCPDTADCKTVSMLFSTL